jgi:hypothetical protein
MNTILQVRADAVQGLPERLLAACFQLLSRAMQAAAHFCGLAQQGALARSVGGLLGAEALGAPDLPGLLHSDLPLSEIAAAERERLARLEALVAVESPRAVAAPHPQRTLH